MLRNIISFFLKLRHKRNEKIEVFEDLEILDGTYFHEDDFRQVEFCPKENLEFLKHENNQVNKFAEEHFDGTGFTDIYLREEHNQKIILEMQIKLFELNSLLLNLGLERIEKVYDGYSSFKEICKNTIAYKFDEAEIFVTIENDYIKDLFITGFRFHENEVIKNKLEEVLYNIGTEFHLILNDWNLAKIIDLTNRKEIKKYLNEELKK